MSTTFRKEYICMKVIFDLIRYTLYTIIIYENLTRVWVSWLRNFVAKEFSIANVLEQ